MRLRHVLAVLVLFLAALPLSAQNWEVYDNFKGPRISPDLWVCRQGNRNDLEYERQIQNGWLRLRIRSYGLFDDSGGFNWATNRLEVAPGKDPEGIIGIRAKLIVTQAIGTSCSSSSIGGLGQVTIGANFFNSGTGLQKDDIYGELMMYSDARGTTNTLSVNGRIINGSGSGDFGSVKFGDVKVGETVSVWIRWDRPAKQIYFGLRHLQPKQPPLETAIPYTFDDVLQPCSLLRAVGMITQPDNCTTTLVYSDMSVKIDQVDVLR